MVLDIDLFREDKGHNPQVIRDSQKKRYKDVGVVDQVISLDLQWRQARFQADQWNKVKNSCGRTVGEKKKAKENEGESEVLPKDFVISLENLTNELLQTLTVKQLKHLSTLIDGEIQKTRERVERLEKERDNVLHEIGNIVHDSVPVSNNEVRQRKGLCA